MFGRGIGGVKWRSPDRSGEPLGQQGAKGSVIKGQVPSSTGSGERETDSSGSRRDPQRAEQARGSAGKRRGRASRPSVAWLGWGEPRRPGRLLPASAQSGFCAAEASASSCFVDVGHSCLFIQFSSGLGGWKKKKASAAELAGRKEALPTSTALPRPEGPQKARQRTL